MVAVLLSAYMPYCDLVVFGVWVFEVWVFVLCGLEHQIFHTSWFGVVNRMQRNTCYCKVAGFCRKMRDFEYLLLRISCFSGVLLLIMYRL